MRLACPKCSATELRLHGTLYRLDVVPRWWLLGRLVTRRTILGHDCSCRRCFYAFTTVAGVIEAAPAQSVHEAVGVNRTSLRPPDEPEPKRVEYDRDVRPDPRDRVRQGR